MRAIGWGKVILLGEHAVVYGYPALAAALDRGVTIAAVPTVARRGDPADTMTLGQLRVDVPAWQLAVAAGDDHPVARGLCRIADALGVGRPSLSLVGDAQIPAGAGLGSSAALAVAIARSLIDHAKRPIDLAAITAAANASEAELHGSPSGVDVAIAVAGGLGAFRKASGLRAITAPPVRVLVGPSGTPRKTADMVERVRIATDTGKIVAPLRELGELTDAGTTALVSGELAKLGAAMDRAHRILGELGVSTPQLDGLCETARRVGAYGAKLTGAGGGGAVIAIAPREREADVLGAWKSMGVTGFVATIGRA
jgi:mevalonate kinase